jgi:hypothetical protein
MRIERMTSRNQRRQRDNVRFADAFFTLAGFRPVSACREALPHDFLSRSIPAPAVLVARVGNRLQPRTRNALERQIASAKDGGDWTYERLIELRGFGMFCLIDVMQALQQLERESS